MPRTDPTRIAETVIDPFADNREAARRELAHCLGSMVDLGDNYANYSLVPPTAQ
jgi:hypothetical protein